MKNTILRTGLALGLIALFSSASIASVSAQFITPYSSPIFTMVYRNTDMLIFVSPQYAYDIEIRTAIESYISAIKEDIGWNTRMVSAFSSTPTKARRSCRTSRRSSPDL